ncbi:hypothetical protein [Aliidiomarina soli]|uniref:Uncharacterized protein n=1 Tax=Aliidiomarina soli TaxID=1928574 RepID=A0A432WEA9_9GAMM|nr:hypothetical protein [Aliidiomarina soli]RUO31233.1 hypothetical protein CWE14_12135 [Aliidiomarina soli]
MSDCFSFRFKEQASQKSSLILFVHGSASSSTITKVIKSDVSENLSPKYLYIMGFGINELEKALLSNELFMEEVGSWIADVDKKLKFLNVSCDGRISVGDAKTEYKYQDSLIEAGAREVFVKRKGLITSSESYHFAKPSGAHCNKFIRASNLFTSGLETAFLAIGILKYLNDDVKRVYVDTSSISFLLSIALQLSKQFEDKLPTIESFGSYDNVNDFDFVEGKETLVFISATTSNGLRNELLEKKNLKKEQIITLLYSSVKSEENNVFDIGSVLEGDIYSVKEENCRLCQRGSKVIDISGEQFLPATPKHETLLIRKLDFTVQRQKFFDEFATKKVFKCDSSPGDGLGVEHFYIDVERVLSLNSDSFGKDLERNVKKYLAQDTELIVALDSAASLSLAKRISGSAKNSLSVKMFNKLNESELEGAPSVMVVASSITSGRKLLSASRKLRRISKTASITYLVAFSKIPTKEQFEQLRKDLTLGGYELIVLRHCPMPRNRDEEVTTWVAEENILRSEADSVFDGDTLLPSSLKARLESLTGECKEDDLFLNSPIGKKLSLRPTFAFWSGLNLDTENATQADVYWTIQSLIHDLRASSEKGLSTSYHTTLISPVCFDRFNDGVIQACILRAAKPIELNYAIDETYSRQITDIILSCISNLDNDQGEGTLEFLMAIWLERLCLKPSHLRELCETKTMNKTVNFLLGKIASVCQK